MPTADSSASLTKAADEAYSARTVTGVLSSRPTARDIKIDGFSMGLNGCELIQVGTRHAGRSWLHR